MGPWKIDKETDYGNSAAQMMPISWSRMARSARSAGQEREEFDEVTGRGIFGYYRWISMNHVDAWEACF